MLISSLIVSILQDSLEGQRKALRNPRIRVPDSVLRRASLIETFTFIACNWKIAPYKLLRRRVIKSTNKRLTCEIHGCTLKLRHCGFKFAWCISQCVASLKQRFSSTHFPWLHLKERNIFCGYKTKKYMFLRVKQIPCRSQ